LWTVGDQTLETIQFRRNFSLNILIRMVALALVGLALLVWKLDFINDVYFRNQLTATGMIINGAIVALFGVGLIKMIVGFLFYAREEKALRQFLANFPRTPQAPLDRVPARSMIHRRFTTLERLYASNTPINQNALASTLVATESTRNSLPKFINNILILTGVFGTIVSLSIALIGASDMLESAVNVSGMGLVVHGMSTALSTTITAIVCFVYFGYFFLKLQDVQTNLLGAVEQVTTNLLLPRFQVHTDTILYELTGLIRSLQQLVNRMEASQSTFQSLQLQVAGTLDAYHGRFQALSGELAQIRASLREGFRLPDDERE
jgi:hypothetical protein